MAVMEVLSSGYTEERTHRMLLLTQWASFCNAHTVHLHCCQEDRKWIGLFS